MAHPGGSALFVVMSMGVVVMMPMTVIVMMMVVVIMMVAVIMMIMAVRVIVAGVGVRFVRVAVCRPGIGAAFGIERRLDLDHARPQPLHHRLDHVIPADAQALRHDLG